MANVGGSGSSTPEAAWVANEFVKRYYEVLSKHPKYLNRFYKEESQFTLTIRNHGVPETRQTVSTTQAIQEKVNSTVQGAKITLEHSEAQYSLHSGVLLQVDGRLVLPSEEAERRYTQIFFLAPQDKGFFVLNDILCLHPAIDGVPAANNAAAAVWKEQVVPVDPSESDYTAVPAAAQLPDVHQQHPTATPVAPAEADAHSGVPEISAPVGQQQQQQPTMAGSEAQASKQQGEVATEATVTAADAPAATQVISTAEPSGLAAAQWPRTSKDSAALAAVDLGPATPTAGDPQQSPPLQQQQQPQQIEQRQQEKQQRNLPQQSQLHHQSNAHAGAAAAAAAAPLSYAERLKLGRPGAGGGTSSSSSSTARTASAPTAGAVSATPGTNKAGGNSSSSSAPVAAGWAPGLQADDGAATAPVEPAGAASSGWADAAPAPSGGAVPASDAASGEASGIFLRGIPNSTTREQLASIFQEYGAIANVSVVPSRTHDTNTAYVDFEHAASSQKALADYSKNPLTLDGVMVTVLPKISKVLRMQAAMSGSGGRGAGRVGGSEFRRSGLTGTYGGRGGRHIEGGRGKPPAEGAAACLMAADQQASAVQLLRLAALLGLVVVQTAAGGARIGTRGAGRAGRADAVGDVA